MIIYNDKLEVMVLTLEENQMEIQVNHKDIKEKIIITITVDRLTNPNKPKMSKRIKII